MRESHKSKRVSWASDVNLCQVKLFLSEESPSLVGLDSQDHLQAKTSWLSHSPATPSSDDVLPPGFEAAHPTNQLQAIVSQIPTIKWKCPPRFLLELTWQVVAGEESKEAEIQSQREMRVLEAVYPRPSAIPPNPAVIPSTEDLSFDDAKTPSIPITPIEDEDASADALSEPMASSSSRNMANPPTSNNPASGVALGAEPGFLAAALTGLTNGNDQGNMIDRELLLKILSNPKMVEKLVTDYGTSTTNNTTQNNPPPVSMSAMALPMSPNTISSGPLYPQPNGHQPNSRPAQYPSPQAMPVPGGPSHVAAPAPDFSYYKSLIQQHGGDRQEPHPPPPPPPPHQYSNNRYNHQPATNQEPMNGHNKLRGDSKPRIMKPCIYFNSSRGCRHGANCSYQHDASFQQRGNSMPEVQSAKRTKFDREISSFD